MITIVILYQIYPTTYRQSARSCPVFFATQKRGSSRDFLAVDAFRYALAEPFNRSASTDQVTKHTSKPGSITNELQVRDSVQHQPLHILSWRVVLLV